MEQPRPEQDATPPSEIDVLVRQLGAIDDWTRFRGPAPARPARDAPRCSATADVGPSAIRAALERESAAVVARTAEHLRVTGAPLLASAPVRALVAHRSTRTHQALATAFAAQGVRVVGLCTDGAAALGATVVEQPDLVVVEDGLPWAPGVDVIPLLRQFAPHAVIATQARDAQRAHELWRTGAVSVLGCDLPATELVARLLSRLARTRCSTGDHPPAAGQPCRYPVDAGAAGREPSRDAPTRRREPAGQR